MSRTIRQSVEYKRGLKRAAVNGIKERTYDDRVMKLGWNVDKAATEPAQIRQPHGAIDKLCKLHGITKVQYKRAYSMLKVNDLPTDPDTIAQLAQNRSRTDLRHWFQKMEDEQGRDFTEILEERAAYCREFGLGLNDVAKEWGVPWPSIEWQARKRGIEFPKRHVSDTIDWKGRKDELTRKAVEMTMTHSALDLARTVIALRQKLEEKKNG